MDTNFEQKVREKAYEIWMSAGMEDGAAHEHWVIAERALIGETGVPVKQRAAKGAAAKKPTSKPVVVKAAAKKPAAAKAPKAGKPVKH